MMRQDRRVGIAVTRASDELDVGQQASAQELALAAIECRAALWVRFALRSSAWSAASTGRCLRCNRKDKIKTLEGGALGQHVFDLSRTC